MAGIDNKGIGSDLPLAEGLLALLQESSRGDVTTDEESIRHGAAQLLVRAIDSLEASTAAPDVGVDANADTNADAINARLALLRDVLGCVLDGPGMGNITLTVNVSDARVAARVAAAAVLTGAKPVAENAQDTESRYGMSREHLVLLYGLGDADFCAAVDAQEELLPEESLRRFAKTKKLDVCHAVASVSQKLPEDICRLLVETGNEDVICAMFAWKSPDYALPRPILDLLLAGSVEFVRDLARWMRGQLPDYILLQLAQNSDEEVRSQLLINKHQKLPVDVEIALFNHGGGSKESSGNIDVRNRVRLFRLRHDKEFDANSPLPDPRLLECAFTFVEQSIIAFIKSDSMPDLAVEAREVLRRLLKYDGLPVDRLGNLRHDHSCMIAISSSRYGSVVREPPCCGL
jgi:hypothetical protein